MSRPALETSPQFYARMGGWLYLITIVARIFAEFFVRSRLTVSGNATATAHNIMAAEGLWRLGFVADLVGVLCYVAVTVVLYVLLRPVNRNLSLLAAFMSLVGCVVLGMDGLWHYAPLLLLGGADYLKAFDPHQLQALALLSLKLHAYGYEISIVFFSFYCLLLGILIFRSGYLPKFLGVLLMIEFLCNITNSSAEFLAPTVAAKIPAAALVPGAVAEAALCLWLIIVGLNMGKWTERTDLIAEAPGTL